MKVISTHRLKDEDYMDLCLAIAKNGEGSVSPNPIVGAVIVKNGEIIGQGYHAYFGGPHAEVHAIKNAKEDVTGSQLYVNLEPCSIFGKTPPCTDLIIRSGILKVIIGTKDPNPRIAGRGILQLRRAGVRVKIGIRREESRKANESFFKYITTGLPFVALKIAQTLDGKIADHQGRSKWISSLESRTVTHSLRSRYDCILVGAGTIRSDDPKLTVRLTNKRNPYRIVVDGRLSCPTTARVFRDQEKSRTIVMCDERYLNRSRAKRKYLENKGVIIRPFATREPGRILPGPILRFLGSQGISSVLVEGGAQMFSLFLSKTIADKIYLFIAPKIVGKGISPFEHLEVLHLNNAIKLSEPVALKIHNDLLIEGYLKKM